MITNFEMIREQRKLLGIRAQYRITTCEKAKSAEDVCTENENFDLLKYGVYQQIIRSDENGPKAR